MKGDFLPMLCLMAVVVVGLTFYWRTPESGGGPQVCPGPPCVVVTMPWVQ